MHTTKKKLYGILGTTLLVCAALFLYKKQLYKATGGFSVATIQFDLPYNPDWETVHPTENLDKIVQQKFTYLAKGARSFAFISEDGNTILKFFKYRYHEPHWALRYLL